MATAATFDPANYNDASGTGFTLGAYYTNGDGNVYRFVKTADAVNFTVGMVAEWASTTAFTVTVDRAGGSSIGRIPAGVAMGNVTASAGVRYCFLLVRGRHTAVSGLNARVAAAGVKVFPYVTNDGEADTIAAYTDNHFGVALAAASGNVFPCEVRL